MRILITGGSGFIGSHLVQSALKRGDTVIVFDRRKSGLMQELEASDKRNFTVVLGEVTDGNLVARTLRQHHPDSVVHLAAITGIGTCRELPRESFETNVWGTYSVAMACIGSGARLIFASSREVYGETKFAASREGDLLVPNNLYGVTKLLAEATVTWAAARQGLKHTILRFTNVYGPGGDKYGLQVLVQQAVRGERIRILGGHQVMNLVFVDDAVRSILMCLDNENAIGKTLNVGSPDTVEMESLVKKILELTGKKSDVQYCPLREGETIFFNPSLEEVNRVLGWRPQVDLKSGLQQTVEWYSPKKRDTQ